ncbi:hypothetical protein ZRA01_37830 [Zoogloea ramigera]|uniref:Uncharacterized protein n=1 Tax=Zoogloea ramigera TaxID=350 RepID=A0A4Y4D4L5_ZOORA|nr:hypothetical protein [Zoogloea ramigera]GEC97710.1 hypothetical protein ZRA01_37830 [Zoogloea ramigera]
MPDIRHLDFRRLVSTLLLVVGLTAAGSGFADDARRYEGLLLPDDFGGPVSMSIELRKLQGLLVGEFKAESPYAGNGRVTSGDMNGSKCDFHVQTGAGPVLHLSGTCTANIFEGKYRQAERSDAGSRGSFRLMSKPADEADDTQSAAARKSAAPASVTQCIEANTRCLLSCPQADPDAAFLCASQCRSRFKSCKSRAALR